MKLMLSAISLAPLLILCGRTVVAQPRLDIVMLENQAVLSWSNSPPYYDLQSRTDAATGSWNTISNGLFWNGNRCYFTNLVAATSQFFRLKLANATIPVSIDVPSYASVNGRWNYRRTEGGTGTNTPWALEVIGTGTENGHQVYILQEYDEADNPNDQHFWQAQLSNGLFEVGGLNDYGQTTQTNFYWQPFLPRLMKTFIPGVEYTNSYTRADWPGVVVEGRIKTDADIVSVPFGTFGCCKASRTFLINGGVVYVETAWFAMNVGLVKRDQNGGDLWELVSYQP